jgi:flagellar biosynthesis protein FlhF
MRIRKFEAATVQQAINKAKTELGERAVILHTRSYPGKLFGLLGKPRVEVTAAVEDQRPNYELPRGFNPAAPRAELPLAMEEPASPPPTVVQGPVSAQEAAQDFLSKIQQIRESQQGVALPTAPAKPAVQNTEMSFDPARFETLEVRIERLANTMNRLLTLGGPLGQMGILSGTPDAWHPAMKRLLESELSERVLVKLSKKLQKTPHPGKELEEKILKELLAGFLKTEKPIVRPETGQRVIALIGPTGVGKTTTLAKLASGLVVGAAVPTRVGLITVDTYRLAAVEQLETYAKILNIDLQVVFGPEEMPAALEKCKDADVVFIDTAGRSPRDDAQMAELKQFLDKVPECEKVLVLSSTMNDRYLEETVERFKVTSLDSLIVTKLDETRNDAAPINIHQITGIPISYVTTGQNVPEDIESVDPGKVAGRILEDLSRTLREVENLTEVAAEEALV